MNDPSWFESWFNSPYYHLLYRDRDESEARPFIERLTRHLNLAPGSRVLDLACGKGRHSIVLADLGFEVWGIDIAPENIAFATQMSRPSLQFAVHDMREPLGADPFDAVLNLFTSFGYFDSEAEHRSALRTMAGAMKPEGKLVIDYLNPDHAIGQLVEAEEREIEGIKFQIQRKAEGDQIIKEIRVNDPSLSAPLFFSEKVAAFRREDFDRMMEPEGLKVREVLGDYMLGPFDRRTSPRMILIAERSRFN